jgi:hypothetical protein
MKALARFALICLSLCALGAEVFAVEVAPIRSTTPAGAVTGAGAVAAVPPQSSTSLTPSTPLLAPAPAVSLTPAAVPAQPAVAIGAGPPPAGNPPHAHPHIHLHLCEKQKCNEYCETVEVRPIEGRNLGIVKLECRFDCMKDCK